MKKEGGGKNSANLGNLILYSQIHFWILWQIQVNIWLKHNKKWYIVSFAEKDMGKNKCS